MSAISDNPGDGTAAEGAKKNEQELERSLGSYHLSLASLQTGRAITKALLRTPFDSVGVIDAEGRVLDLNQAAAARFGQPRINIIGKSVWDLLPYQLAVTRKSRFESVFASGEPVRFEDEREGLWYDNIIYPVSAEHRVICAIIVAHDITARHQAEQELHRSKIMLDQAQRLAMVGSWDIELKTATIRWSDELYRMLGYAPGEIEPSVECIFKHVHPDDHQKFLSRNQKEQGTDTYSQLGAWTEMRIIARDGKVKWVQGAVEAEYDEARAICRICGTVQDITNRKQMEVALRESEDKFKGLFVASGEGILLCNSSWRIIGFNAALERITGRRAGDYIGMDAGAMIVEFFPAEHKSPELYDYFQERLAMFLSDRDSVSGEFTMEPEPGSQRMLAYNIFRIPLGPDCLYGGILRDITEMRQSEEKSQRLGRILEESLNEIYIIDAQTFRFMMVNRGARENLGYTMQELSEMTPVDIKPDFNHAGFSAMLEPLRSGKLKVLQFETVHRRKDGTTYPVEVCLHCGSYDTREVFVANVLDSTSRKANEEALRKSEERFRAIFNNAGIGIGLVDREGRYVQVNSRWADMLGYTERELLQMKHLDVMHPDDREHVLQKISQLEGGSIESYYGERRFTRKDGSIFWVSGAATPLPDGRGGFEAIIGLAADVTDRKIAEHEREKLIAELTEAIAQIRTLKGLLPICSSCKKIRDDRGYWNTLESYISEHSQAEFTHGLCPDCIKKYFPDLGEDLQ